MLTDMELIELAAKASGNTIYSTAGLGVRSVMHWNPLTDDGDAFRLAVKLKLLVEYFPDFESEMSDSPSADDPQRAARRAIVNAAAKIGELKC